MTTKKIAKIYIIECKDENVKDCYVGATDHFKVRKSNHKHIVKNVNHKNHHLPLYQSILKNGGWNNWRMRKLKTVKYKTREYLSKKENHYYKKYNANLNVVVPARTAKQYAIDNRETILEKKRKFYRDQDKHVANMEKYMNKDGNREKWRKYYKERNRKLIRCECGKMVAYGYYCGQHKRTQYHIENTK